MSAKGRDTGTSTRRCCFADAVGTRIASCAMAAKSSREHRRTVCCTNNEAHEVCAAWLDHVRRGSRFTLGTQQPPSALPRAAAIKLQGGGLLGMGDLIGDHQPSDRVQDVSGLLRRALNRYGSFERVPLQQVIQRIHEFDADDD